LLRLHGKPDVVALPEDDFVARQGRVQLRVLLEPSHDGLQHVREVRALAPGLRERGEVALLDDRDRRNLAVGAREVLGDLAPDSPQRLAPIALDRSGPATDVFLRDPAAGASTPYRSEVHSQFLGDPPDERGRLHLLRRARGSLAVGADENEWRANRDELALGHEDLRHLAGSRRGDLDRRLVGLDLDEGVVLGDVLPHLHQPARDLSLADALAQVGKLELVGHQKERTCSAASTTRAGEGMCSSSSDQKGKGTS